jgi:hypothetical protein
VDLFIMAREMLRHGSGLATRKGTTRCRSDSVQKYLENKLNPSSAQIRSSRK